MRVLVTGNAGFIGYHVARRLLERGDEVVGIDRVDDYYDVGLKRARLDQLEKAAQPGRYTFHCTDLADEAVLDRALEGQQFERVIHLAAQAGVRHSIDNPRAYIQSNLVGFANLLEVCRALGVGHLTYASSSSIYGANTRMPFSEHDGADHPLQLYAATKRSNELMAHAYSHLYGFPTTGLRFFTVYGPWGRPDMALFKFTRAILAGEPIELFNNGDHSRDFTYVDDIVEGVIRASEFPAQPDPGWDGDNPDPATSSAPWRIFNIGNSRPVRLGAYVEALESALGRKAIRHLVPAQPGDVPDTFADTSELRRATGYAPTVPVEEGVRRFVEWYRQYYG
jgi:UDP-glucuronate 4-epimerase